MSAEADVLCNAEYGQVSDERVNHRNGYRPREWDARAGTVELAIPKLRSGSYFPHWLLAQNHLNARSSSRSSSRTALTSSCIVCGETSRLLPSRRRSRAVLSAGRPANRRRRRPLLRGRECVSVSRFEEGVSVVLFRPSSRCVGLQAGSRSGGVLAGGMRRSGRIYRAPGRGRAVSRVSMFRSVEITASISSESVTASSRRWLQTSRSRCRFSCAFSVGYRSTRRASC